MALPTHGTMAVDWEQRIDFDRLRRERLQRVKDMLAKSEMGSLLCFDMNNVRYLTATHIARGHRTRRTGSRSFHRMTNRFSGTSDRRPGIINCIARGSGSARG